jgi:hypothetical protein
VKKLARIVLVGLLIAVAPATAIPADHGFGLGYGFGAFNNERQTGRIEGGASYDFIQALYSYERPLSSQRWSFVAEPFVSFINRPAAGIDLGLDVGFRYYPILRDARGLYVTGGPGMAYTTIGFKEQGTHFLFILEGGVGYKFKNFYVEDRLRHYSNGGTARPNWSVNANILSLGARW